MNTGKQINAMVVVLFILLVSLGAYSVWDPFRADTKENKQEELTLERAANTYALNCRLCHGDRGQGGQNGGRLPAALPLDVPRLQGITEGVFSQASYDEAFKVVSNTIMCGRVGTVMPTWGRSQGGILSDEQIRQLAELITSGSWDYAQAHADELDAATTKHATLQMPAGSLSADTMEVIVTNAEPFALGQYVRIGDERLRVLPKQLRVERGVQGTEAVEHERGAPITGGPEREIQPTLAEPVAADSTAIAVADTKGFLAGDVLQIEEELVRVTGTETGLPSTGQFLAKDVGREPRTLLVSGAAGIDVGQIIRLDGELLEVVEVRDHGNPGIELDRDLTAEADQISVSDAEFFREGYVVRIGDELIEVVEAVTTDQTLGSTIGRAETIFEASGTGGLSEGMTLRVGSELMRVVEIVSPTSARLERAADGSAAAAHPAGTAIVRITQPSADEAQDGATPEPVEEATGQTLMEGIASDGTSAIVTGSAHIAVDGTYKLGDETVRITALEPAVIRVVRGVDGTERAVHGRRSEIFVRNLLAVTRGVEGTAGAAHNAGDELLFTELRVKRVVLGSLLQDHQKGDELYLGNRLVVARGVLGSTAAEHANGDLVYNFPPAPDGPSINQAPCGQRAVAGPGPAGPTPTPLPGAQEVAISLTEFAVAADPPTIVDGPIQFNVSNAGTALHNFRVIRTDLDPASLPVDSATFAVDESQLDVVGGFTAFLQAGGTQSSGATLPPGTYVLICNVPTHYEAGMHVAFEVTAP